MRCVRSLLARRSSSRSTMSSGSMPPPAGALGYAARRLRHEHIGVLLSRRAPLESPLLTELRRSLPPGRYQEIEVGPLGVLALHRVVQAHLGVVLPRPLLAEVHDASGGNPFYALEIVRTLQRTGVSVEAGQPLPRPRVAPRSRPRPPAGPLARRAVTTCSPPRRTRIRLTSVVEAASGVGRDAGLVPASRRGSSRSTASGSDSPTRCSRPVRTRRRIRRVGPRYMLDLQSCWTTPRHVPGSWRRRFTQPDESVAAVARGCSPTCARARRAPAGGAAARPSA